MAGKTCDGLRGYCGKVAEMAKRAGQGDSMYALLAEHGVEREWSPHSFAYGLLGECFKNATDVALYVDGVHYVEGLALAGSGLPLPIEHAWVEDDDGRVIEVTWQAEERETGEMRYLGVRVPDKVLCAALVRNEVYGVLCDPVVVGELREVART